MCGEGEEAAAPRQDARGCGWERGAVARVLAVLARRGQQGWQGMGMGRVRVLRRAACRVCRAWISVHLSQLCAYRMCGVRWLCWTECFHVCEQLRRTAFTHVHTDH